MFTLPTKYFGAYPNFLKHFWKKKIETPSECQTLWIQIRTIRIQICVQTVNSLLSADDKSHPSKGSVTVTVLYLTIFFISLYSSFD